MKGKVLGAGGQGGTISGEDGKRYQFDSAQWKSERAPAAGDDVDFEASTDGKALDIYSVRSGVTVDFGAVGQQAKALLNDGTSSPIGARLIALVTSNPLFQISLLVLVASCFFTFVKLSTAIAPGASEAFPDRGIYKIVSTNDLVDYLKTSLDAAAVGLDQLTQMTSGEDAATQAALGASPLGNTKDAASNLHTASTLSNVLYLVYLAPLGAAALIVQLVRQKSLSLIPLATGAACILSFGLLVVCRSEIISAVKKMGNADAADMAGKAIVFGLGSYLILLCGLALVGLSLGIVRMPQRA